MKKIKYILALCAATIGFNASAQQQQQLTQFMHNPYIINPAYAGLYDMIDINVSYRQQWVGIDGAPETFYISYSGPLGGKKRPSYNPSLRISRTGGPSSVKAPKVSTGRVKHGIGGYLMHDRFGHFKRTTGMLSYAFHMPVVKGYNISVSAVAGLSNHTLSQLNLLDVNDPFYASILAQGGNQNYFDLSTAALFYSEDLFIGYTGTQMLKTALPFNNDGGDFDLQMHHFILAGYNFDLNNDKIKLTPSVLVKYMHPAPMMFDVNVKAVFNNWIWGGVSYRHNDALSMMFGLYASNIFKLGYSYDFSISGLQSYNSGSHEVVLGITLGNQ